MKNILKSALLALSVLFLAGNAFGQAGYSGLVGESPVTMVTNIYSDGVGQATYVYDNFDEPIRLEGKVFKKKLTFVEKDAKKLTRATLTFDNFDAKSDEMNGVWKDAKTGKTLDIKLKKDFDVGYGTSESVERELIQTDSLPDRYFKVVVAGERALAVKIFEKKTDRLIQKIALDCQQRGAESISVGDYNFDGIKDFSIFESSYAGPNTSSLYYLYDPTKKEFFDSKYEGTSLEFNEKTKRISETNQCCAGSSITSATYKVVKNKMVLVSQHCLRWDEKKGELVERPMKQCQ
jgi:hypothetical protein